MLQLSKLQNSAGVAELADGQDLGAKSTALETKHLAENKTT